MARRGNEKRGGAGDRGEGSGGMAGQGESGADEGVEVSVPAVVVVRVCLPI